MRILAGKLKGRIIHRPKTSSTRPMTDKVRAALFNIVGSVEDLRVLDAYAGSGAIGFEALSHGAASVTGVEASKTVVEAIKKSVRELGLKNYELVQTKVEQWLNKASTTRFNLVVADPPYEQIDAQILDQLGSKLNENGILVVSHSSRIAPPELKSVSLVDSRTYGDSTLSFYK